jgi:phosphatidate cytidylyltransferase
MRAISLPLLPILPAGNDALARGPADPDPPLRAPALGGRFRDLGLRLASAAVLVPVALLGVWWGDGPFVALVALLAAGLIWEWAGITFGERAGAARIFGAIALIAVSLACAMEGVAWAVLLLLVAGAASLPLFPPRRFASGLLYVGAAAIALLWLRNRPQSGSLEVFFLLFVVWATDSGAYLAGRLIGGRVSPAKTWAGLAGGMGMAFLIAALFPLYVGASPAAALRAGSIGMGLALVAQGGDLAESALKRRFGKKDSGHLIPGHGGLLDRLDGLLAAAPMAALLALILGRRTLLWI